jgi:hypothetical protein
MEPDYVVHISGAHLKRSTSYSRSVTALFDVAPGLGLVVHEFVLNGDRLCMHFSEHGAMPSPDGPKLACWRGIGLYKWNGTRLTENYVEQDYFALRAQLASDTPHPLTPPHLDPWVTTEPIAPNADAEALVRAWVGKGDLGAAGRVHVDDGRTGVAYESVLDVSEVTFSDLFSAGNTVPFHATFRGAYRGGLGNDLAAHVGSPASISIAGIARVVDGTIASVDAVTTRLRTVGELTGSPIPIF